MNKVRLTFSAKTNSTGSASQWLTRDAPCPWCLLGGPTNTHYLCTEWTSYSSIFISSSRRNVFDVRDTRTPKIFLYKSTINASPVPRTCRLRTGRNQYRTPPRVVSSFRLFTCKKDRYKLRKQGIRYIRGLQPSIPSKKVKPISIRKGPRSE